MPKALIIDDETALTVIISRFLESAGFETETASSGPEGLEKALSLQPDVVIVDIMMPDMDGYQVCQRLRSDPRTARPTIVALTARGQSIDRRMAFRAGADAHVTKPFKGKELVEQIQELLRERSCLGPPLSCQILVLRLMEKAGATTLATNLALALAQKKGCQTTIADFVFQNGMVPSRLNMSIAETWLMSSQNDSAELATHLLRHESGLFVLPAPSSPPGGQVAPATIGWVLRTLRAWADYLLIDTPVNMGLLAAPLLRSSHLILLVMTPEPTILRQAKTSLSILVQSGVRPSQIWPVLNMMRPEQLPLQQQIEKLWGRPVPAILPWSPEECGQAITSHRPILLTRPESELPTAIRDLAQQIVQTAHPKAEGERAA